MLVCINNLSCQTWLFHKCFGINSWTHLIKRAEEYFEREVTIVIWDESSLYHIQAGQSDQGRYLQLDASSWYYGGNTVTRWPSPTCGKAKAFTESKQREANSAICFSTFIVEIPSNSDKTATTGKATLVSSVSAFFWGFGGPLTAAASCFQSLGYNIINKWVKARTSLEFGKILQLKSKQFSRQTKKQITVWDGRYVIVCDLLSKKIPHCKTTSHRDNNDKLPLT